MAAGLGTSSSLMLATKLGPNRTVSAASRPSQVVPPQPPS